MCGIFSLPLMCCKSSQLWCFYFHTLMQFHYLCPMNFYVFIYEKIERRAFWESSVWQIVIKWACFWFYLFWGKGEGLDNSAFVLPFYQFERSKWWDIFYIFISLWKSLTFPLSKKLRMRYIESFQNLLLIKYQWPYFTNEVCASTGTPFQQ